MKNHAVIDLIVDLVLFVGSIIFFKLIIFFVSLREKNEEECWKIDFKLQKKKI